MLTDQKKKNYRNFVFRKNADLQMEGQFLVRQIYDDELTYNLISAAEEVLRKFLYRNPVDSW